MSFGAAWLIMLIIALGIAAVKIEKITRDPRWAGQTARRRGMWLGITVVLTIAVLVPPAIGLTPVTPSQPATTLIGPAPLFSTLESKVILSVPSKLRVFALL